MKKISFMFTMLLTVLMSSLVITSCSSDDEDGGSIDKATSLIVGSWACVYQEWTEDGETWSSSYEPSSNYFIQLNEDKSGYMISDSDQLFEIWTWGKKEYFSWVIKEKNGRNFLVTDIYSGEEYQIDKLNSNSLEMTWIDEDYRIYCKFEKVGEK